MSNDEIVSRASAEIEAAQTSAQLNDIRVKYLGKKGEITMLMKQMGSLEPEQRPAFGQAVNAARNCVEQSQSAKARRSSRRSAWISRCPAGRKSRARCTR